MGKVQIKVFPSWFKTSSRGMSLYPIAIFVKRKDYSDYYKLVNHEKIHWQQQKEMLCIFFYLWYLIEWIVNIFIYKRKAYLNLSHEQEAYDNDKNMKYLKYRKRFAWIKYLNYKPVK